MRPSHAPLRTRIAALAVAALAAGGCYYPGGPMWSWDQFTYESTVWQPYTITLVDTRTGQTLWTVDVPVEQQLVMRFNDGQGTADNITPTMMEWELMPRGRRFGGLANAMPVPGRESRRVDVTLRKTPELPPDMTAAGTPVNPGPVRTRNQVLDEMEPNGS